MVALFAVAAAISCGAIIIAPTHSVGPYRLAVSDDALWACLDLAGAPVPVLEEWTETVPFFSPITGQPIPMLAGAEPMARLDWSAFGAAEAFVAAVGERAALRALAKARKEAA